MSRHLFGQDARVGRVAVCLVDRPRKLFGAVIFVQKVVRDLLQVGKVRVEERLAETAKVRVLRVVDLDDAPGVSACSDVLASDLDLLF